MVEFLICINVQADITRILKVEVEEEDTAGDRETITHLKEIGEIPTHQGDSKTGTDMLFLSKPFGSKSIAEIKVGTVTKYCKKKKKMVEKGKAKQPENNT